MKHDRNRRRFIRLAGGGAVFAALPTLGGCSGAPPPEAIAAWRGPQNEPDLRRWLLSYAILAPHSHNLQSWLVDLRVPNEITLYCDLERLLPETDPQSRQMVLSQGTFLELLDLAARERGQHAEIELFPEGAFAADRLDRRPTARIRLTPDTGVQADPLFAQITRRRTNRAAYDLKEVPAPALRAIRASVAARPVRVGFVGLGEGDRIRRHRALAAEAWRTELVTPRTILESYRLLRVGPDEILKHRNGLVLNDFLPRLLVRFGLFDRGKAPGPADYATTSQLEDFNAKLEATPAFFWMITGGNDRHTQIEAGRAYVRAQLAATAQGLSMHPLSQALQEYPEQTASYVDAHRLLGAELPRETVQMWVRLGVGPSVGPSPRRGVDDHLLYAQR